MTTSKCDSLVYLTTRPTTRTMSAEEAKQLDHYIHNEVMQERNRVGINYTIRDVLERLPNLEKEYELLHSKENQESDYPILGFVTLDGLVNPQRIPIKHRPPLQDSDHDLKRTKVKWRDDGSGMLIIDTGHSVIKLIDPPVDHMDLTFVDITLRFIATATPTLTIAVLTVKDSRDNEYCINLPSSQ